MIGQQRSQLHALICAAVKFSKIVGHLLKAKDIGVCHPLRYGDDPRQVGHAVATFSALDIPRNQPHQRMPARMKDCTNCRWNSRNANSSGAIVITVAAVMIDQSTPVSGAPNTARPTVSGRASTELVTISGHRKLFQ